MRLHLHRVYTLVCNGLSTLMLFVLLMLSMCSCFMMQDYHEELSWNLQGLVYWAQSYWNWMDFLSYGLVLVILIIELVHEHGRKLEILGILVPISAIMLWAKFLYYAQAFRVSTMSFTLHTLNLLQAEHPCTFLHTSAMYIST